MISQLAYSGIREPGVMDAIAEAEMLQALAMVEAGIKGLHKSAMMQSRAIAAQFGSRPF